MGLFDNLKTDRKFEMNPQRAIMTIVVSAVTIDGEVSRSETRRLKGMCALSPLFSENTTAQDEAVVEFAVNASKALGRVEAIRRATEALDRDLRETAFAYAADVVVADGILENSEKEFMEGLAHQLGISEGVARALVETSVIRNRGL